MTTEQIRKKVKSLLDYDDTTLYDEKLNTLILGAQSKLKNEGIADRYTDDTTEEANDYIICIASQVAMDGGFDTDVERMQRLYLNRVIPLRENQAQSLDTPGKG